MPRLFLSYRVADATHAIDHLEFRLRQVFGDGNVFRDKSSLNPGDPWPDRLRSEVEQCDVLLAVIGPEWLRATDEAGRRRLDQPEDWVRNEILLRLQLKRKLIPVLVGDAQMPRRDHLPEVLQTLADLQSAPLRTGGDYEADFTRLVETVEGGSRGEVASLPPPPVLCTGRDDLIRLVLDMVLQAGGGVPLAGPGGIGKSTIALRVLHHPEAMQRFEDRRHFARLDAATSAAATEQAVGIAVGLPLEDPRPIRDRLLEFLRANNPRLLVLDNAETPLVVYGLPVRELLRQIAATGVSVIATLRPEAALGPGWHAAIPVRRVTDQAAMTIFHGYSGGRFEGEAGLVNFIRSFDGHPLPVRLVAEQASWYSRMRDLEDAWRRKRTALLTEGVAAGEAGFAASLEVSVASPAMTPQALRLLSLLGKLPDGIHYDDVLAVLGEEGADAPTDLRRAGGIAYDDSPRLRVLAPVRQFLQDRHPVAEDDWLSAARHYAELAAIEGPRLGFDGGAEAVRRLLPELGNLDLAVREMAKVDLDRAVRAVVGLAKFSRFAGLDFRPLLKEVLGFARRSDDTPRQAECIQGLGDIANARSHHETARACYDEALLLYEKAGNVLGQAHCIFSLGTVAHARSDHESARARYDEARLLYAGGGFVRQQANCIIGLASIAQDRSDDETAKMLYDEALPMYEKAEDVLGQANCILGLGEIARMRSDYEGARARYNEALRLYERVGAVLGPANCIQSLGDIALWQSDYETAHLRYAEALPLYEKVGAVLGQANCIQSLGDIALGQSDYETARTRYSEALSMFEKVGSVLGQANCARGLGDVAAREGYLDQARADYQTARDLFSSGGSGYGMGWTDVCLARISADDDSRRSHVRSAREVWTKAKRDDLLQLLRTEFPGDE